MRPQTQQCGVFLPLLTTISAQSALTVPFRYQQYPVTADFMLLIFLCQVSARSEVTTSL